jgi:predicted Zn-dependent protease
VILAIVLGFFYQYFNSRITLERTRATLALRALGDISRGENDEALKKLSELKKIHKDDITPYELSSDIYRKEKKFDRARAEYDTFFKQNHGRVPTESEKKFMLFDEKTLVKKPKVAPQPLMKDKQASDAKPRLKRKKRSLNRRKRPVKRTPSTAPAKKKKNIYLVNPDSISYF